MVTDEEILDYLEHFGVRGMHWGVRKVSEEKQSKRDAKAQKYVDKAANIQKQIDTLKSKRYTPGFYSKRVRIQKLTEEKQRAEKDADLKRQGKLSTRQKQVAVGAGVAAGILAAYGTYQSLNSGNARRLVVKGKAFMTKSNAIPWKKNLSLADPNMSVDSIRSKVVSHINPRYGLPGTKQNCLRATYAYEMRRRGYDVKATLSTNARGQNVSGLFNASHPGVNLVPPGKYGMLPRLISEKNKTSKPFTEAVRQHPLGDKLVKFPGEVYDEISNHPNRARGSLNVQWFTGGAHSMAWEIIDGKPVIFDAQNGKVFKTKDELRQVTSLINRAGISRLDNIPLNNDFLTRWLK